MKMSKPIHVGMIMGKWLGGGVESVVVFACMETLLGHLFKPFKIKELQFS